MEKKSNIYPQLDDKSREQIIEIAKGMVMSALNDVDLSDYRDVRVWKTSKYVRVRFEANISVREQERKMESKSGIFSPRIGSSITFVSNERSDDVQPKDVNFLFKYTDEIRAIAQAFDARDSLSFSDKGDAFHVRVSHPSTSKRSGGSEVYSVNKKTLTRNMIQHEHPLTFENSGSVTKADGKPYIDPDPEIEMPDPAFPPDPDVADKSSDRDFDSHD